MSLKPSSMVLMDTDGQNLGRGVPSSEWRIHRDIFVARADVGAVVHTHSTFAATLCVHRKSIPAFHYMIAVAGGDSIRCAPYALFGTQALSDGVIKALKDRRACLMANHGLVALGSDLSQAVAVAIEVESLCEMYWRALQLGEPHILGKSEMDEVIERFKHYGQHRAL
jgi:L-fuculose-phosphate aldolase